MPYPTPKTPIQYKEDLLDYFLTKNVRFGIATEDLAFFSSIRTITRKSKKITSNQDRLLVHLAKKYCRRKNVGVDLNKLAWKRSIVIDSDDKFLTPSIKIVNNKLLYFYMPYNQNWRNLFVKTVRDIRYREDSKAYICDLNTYNLKILINFSKKLGRPVAYCDQIKKLLERVDHINKARFKHPTLVKSNGNYYVYALNEHLYEAIKDIPLNDSLGTLHKLYQYGIIIDKSVISRKSSLNAINKYKVKCNSTKQVLDYIKLFGTTSVIYSVSPNIYGKPFKRKKFLENALKENNIKLLTEYEYRHERYDKIIPTVLVTNSRAHAMRILKKFLHKTLFLRY